MIECFDTASCAEDFAGSGRTVTVEADGNERHMWVAFPNGWKLSVTWGFGAYAHGPRRSGGAIPDASPTAEVAAWKNDGDLIDLDFDTVAGFQTPAAVLAAIEAAERDDEDGIRRAFGWKGAIA